MAADMQHAPPNQIALYWLRRTMKGLTWLTIGTIVLAIVSAILSALTSSYYHPSLVTVLSSICAIITFGGITALCLIAVTRLIDVWAEIVDSGRHKTALLETLLSDPVDQEG